jgi:N-acyl amino acid synthase FeeM
MALVASLAFESQFRFSDRVAQLLDRIDCRLADSVEDREAIFRLRYDAYLQEEAITPNFAQTFYDPFDDADNVWLFGLYIDGDLASSIRLHVASEDNRDFPSRHVFADVLEPELDAGKVIIDPTRFVTHKDHSRVNPGLTYATCRLAWRRDISAPSICSRRFARNTRLSTVAPSTIAGSATRDPTRCWQSRSA